MDNEKNPNVWIFFGILLPLFLIFLGKRTQESITECNQYLSKKHFFLILLLLIVTIALKYYFFGNNQELKILLLTVVPCLLICLWSFSPNRMRTFCMDFECVIAIVCLCIVIVSFGADGGIAILLSKLPVIKSFRYLYKVTLLFIPLMAIPAASELDVLINWTLKYKHHFHLVLLVTIVIVIDALGLCNNYYIYTSGVNEYTNNAHYKYNDGTDYYTQVKNRLMDLNVDTENYRILACLPGETVSDFIEFASSESYVYMTKNLNTAYKCFTLMGYCNSITTESYEQSNAIMRDMTLNGQFTNAEWGSSYFEYLNSLDTDNPKVQKFYKQMNQNAVKYFICNTEDVASIDQFSTLINKSGNIYVESITPFLDSATIITLGGVNSIVTDNNQNPISQLSVIDTLTIPLENKTDNLIVSMTYDPYYVATYHSPNGTTRNLKVISSADYYTIIQTTGCDINGYITLTYKNIVCDIVMIMSLIITLLFIILIIYILCTRRKVKSYET